MQFTSQKFDSTRFLELTSILEGHPAGCDPEFDAVYDDLEREFAELRFSLNHN
ncbi:hypothetical protein KIH39_22785 [Telmatocola sphagniphila]|uniref:Uncharacterized protein n=1 Tax=Telmatocola sphagniphila TaxID=1123043 RepID=A0A8E6B5R1_9BACT|nr:hypothetical protein [Telmatocola sphagniphila]QVL31641.1 hypothetical protein KIH39_22785 [Telmatocola sphagniphila]